MRKLLCPQCKIAALYVKNDRNERLLVYVMEDGEVVPKNPADSMEGFDLTEVYCLGCSWHGSPKDLVEDKVILEHRRMATSKEMTAGPALPLILRFTLPLLLGNLLQQTYSLVDAAIVGKFLGINSLASVGASTSVVFLILGFCNGCCGGFGIPVAQKFGGEGL